MAFVFLHLTYFTQQNVVFHWVKYNMSIHVVTNGRISSFLWLCSIPAKECSEPPEDGRGKEQKLP